MFKLTNKFNKLSVRLAVVLVVGCWLLVVSYTGAQVAPQFLVSWQAANYVPPDYQGLILPSNNSPVEISFDLIDNGRVVNLSRYNIRWSLDDKLFASGPGLKSASFLGSSDDQTIRITVAGYNGVDLDKFVEIPGTRPEVVIEAKSPTRTRGLGEQEFAALPYFFNAASLSELLFFWRVNGQQVDQAAANPEVLTLNLSSGDAPAQTEIVISASVQNVFNILEVASKLTTFIIQ